MARDMTHAEFIRAARRNGFRPILDGWLEDTTAPEGQRVAIGNIFNRRPVRLLRRESIANAIRRRAAYLETQRARQEAV